MIQLKDIDISFEGKVIHKNFNLEIKQGTQLVISGESGRGKTTILKMMAGIQYPDRGTIIVNGIELSPETVEKIRQEIVWIPQNINLPVENGKELIEMMQISSNREIITQYLSQLNLNADILTKSFSEVSGGEKQRIIIAVCLSLNGSIILLDEPTAALDNSSKQALLDLIQSLQNKTIVSVSHDEFWINNTKNRLQL